MKWIRLKNCMILRKGGALTLVSQGAEMEETEKRPAGSYINRELAEGSKGDSLLHFLGSSADGSFEIGDLRPGVGGAFVLPYRQLDFGPNSEDAERIAQNLGRKFGFVREAMIAVVRGQSAPGTQGIDGGGAGIPGVFPQTPEALSIEAYKEMFGEIAVIEADSGRLVGLKTRGSLGEKAIEEINAEIAKEAHTSHGLKIGAYYADAQLLANPDQLVIGDPKITDWILRDIALAFEIKNASVEITRIFNLILDPALRYRFLDLEHDNAGKILAPGGRHVAVICKGEKLYAAYYHNGHYQDGVATNLESKDSLLTSTNEKCRKLLWLLHWIKAGDLQ